MFRAIGLSIAASLALLVAPSWAIVVSDEPNAAWHLAPAPSEFDGVGYLTSAGGCTATLINPWFIITANHTLNNYQNRLFQLDLVGGRQDFGMIQKWQHPTVDMAIVRLSRPAGLDGYEPYQAATQYAENGLAAYIVGYGMSGTPATVGAGGDPAYPRGTKRVGQNALSLSGTYGEELDYDFDHPSTTMDPNGSLGADKEVMIGQGDSGGPTFLRVDGVLQLAGIHIGVTDIDDDGKYPEYGDKGYDIRVSQYLDWIASILPDAPATQTGDFNMDSLVNATDINSLFAHRGGTDMWYDLTGDSVISQADVDNLIRVKIATEYGDANLDRAISVGDLAILAANWGQSGKGWGQGDFAGDGTVDVGDLGVLAAHWGWMPPGGAGGISVPEPLGLSLLACGALLVPRRRR